MTTPEIPEEAVAAAIAAFDDFEMRAMNAVEDQDTHFDVAMRAALEAALPHLRVQETAGVVEVLAKHRDRTFSTGDGYNEPYEASLYCSCDPDEPLAVWVQTENGADLDFDLIHASHVASLLPAPHPRPVVDREALIKALHDAGAYCGECNFEDWDLCTDCQTVLAGYADAVLALLVVPTEEVSA